LPFSDFNVFSVFGLAASADGALILSGRELPGYVGVPVRSVGADGRTTAALARLEFPPDSPLSVTHVVNAATLLPAPISPGGLFEIRGTGLGESSTTRVLFDGQQAVVNGGNGSPVALAPETVAGASTVSIEVERSGVYSAARTVRTAAANPGLFTANGTGAGQALAENADGTLNSPETPVLRGAVLRLLGTGLGAAPTVAVSIAGFDAHVNGVRPAPGHPPGCVGIDVTVPRSAPPGDYLEVRLRVNDLASQPGVTVAIR
jgi:uncharacterized protein (TIGR03437 family)